MYYVLCVVTKVMSVHCCIISLMIYNTHLYGPSADGASVWVREGRGGKPGEDVCMSVMVWYAGEQRKQCA